MLDFSEHRADCCLEFGRFEGWGLGCGVEQGALSGKRRLARSGKGAHVQHCQDSNTILRKGQEYSDQAPLVPTFLGGRHDRGKRRLV